MTSKKIWLSVNDIKVGMIAASDIYLGRNILLAEGSAVTELVISRLKRNYLIDKIEIYSQDAADEPKESNYKKTTELESIFTDFSSSLENLFDTISNQKVAKMEEIRDFSKKIREEFSLTGTVIKNISFSGSQNNNVYRHSINVAAISFILGKWLGLNEKEINFLTYSAILHDFGKVKMDEKISNNNGKLSLKEYKIFKNHPVIGYYFVKNIPYLDSSVSYGVLMHHERIDGTGYPFGIKNGKIHKFAKIIAIADLFDEVCSNKYNQKNSGPFEALAIIQQESGQRLDYNYCTMFLNHMVNYFIGETVLLSNNRTCKIVNVDMNNITKPVLLDENGLLDLREVKDIHVEKMVI
jgi:HD-GYP domain-containing protein (c-di-GMP phosphodiesterase class II)